MKNIMRRTVAFMLMACLLLSVMAPAAFAETTNADGSVTYSYSLGSSSSGSHTSGLPCTNGDFTLMTKNNVNVKWQATYYQAMSFYPNNDATKPQWFSVQINKTIEKGLYSTNIRVSAGGTTNPIADVYLVPAADYATADIAAMNTASEEYIGTVSRNSNDVGNVEYTSTGSYVFVFKPNADSVNGNLNLYDITLDPIPVASVDYVYDFGYPTANTQAVYSSKTGEVSDYLKNAYDAGEINWLPLAHSLEGTSLPIQIRNSVYPSSSGVLSAWDGIAFDNREGVGEWFAVQIDNPGKTNATYNVSALFGLGVNNTTSANMYLIPSSILDGVAAEDVEATIQTAIDGDTYLRVDAEGSAISANMKAGYTTLGAAGADPVELGQITMDANEDSYIFVAKALKTKGGYTSNENDANNTQAYMWFRSLTLTQEYTTVESAVAAAGSQFDTVQLAVDASVEGTLNIGTGATLDLNGKALDATVNVTNGSLVDSSNGAGSVSKVTDATGNKKSVLISDGSVVRAYNYTAKENGYKVNTETGALEFWFDADFDAAVYSKLTAANGITINAVLKVNGDVVAVIGLDDKVAQWVAQDGTEDNALGVSVTGYENLSEGDTITVAPVFTDNYGTFGVFGGEIVYTVPAAE